MLDKTLLARFGREPETATAALVRELGAFEGLPEQLSRVWLTPCAPGKWSPAETTEHVIKVGVGMSKTLHLLRLGAPLPLEARAPGTLLGSRAQAPAFSQPGPPQPWRVLKPLWFDMQSRLLNEVDEPHSWSGRTRFHPYFGDLDALGWVQAAALHVAHHRRQLGAA